MSTTSNDLLPSVVYNLETYYKYETLKMKN